MFTFVAAFPLFAAALLPSQKAVRTELVNTEKYSFEVPAGWSVGKETPWGARDITPAEGEGKLGAMTAGPSQAGWDELYRTSLYFIQREEKGKATSYRVEKTKLGYESIRFEVADSDGFKNRRYALLKDSKGNALALSVKIPNRKLEEEFAVFFQGMIDTAKIKG